MSRIYVNIDRLRKRCREGETVRRRIFDDLKRLENDLKMLRKSSTVSAEDIDVLNNEMKMLRNEAENITAVCGYDRYAAERYAAALERMENMTVGVRL